MLLLPKSYSQIAPPPSPYVSWVLTTPVRETPKMSDLVSSYVITLNVVTDQDERQFTEADINILVPNVKGLLVQISYGIMVVERAETVRSIKSGRLVQVVLLLPSQAR